MGIDERGWRALETLAREINARSPEATAREVSKRAVEVAKAAGIFALDRLVSRLAGRRVDTAPRALPTDGGWVRRAIVGGPVEPAPTPRERPTPSPAQAAQEPLTADNTPPQAVQAPLTADNTPSQGRQEPLTADNTPSQAVQEPLTADDTPSQAVQAPLTADNTPSQAVQEPLEPVAAPSDATQTVLVADNTALDTAREAVAEVYPEAAKALEVSAPVPVETPSVEAAAVEPMPSLRPSDAPSDLHAPRTDEPLPALPARYGIDRVVMLAAESEWVFVYWETAPARLGRTNRAELRLLTEAGALVGRAYVDPVQGRQHLRVPARGQRYTAELVLLDGTVLSRSRPVLVRAPEST